MAEESKWQAIDKCWVFQQPIYNPNEWPNKLITDGHIRMYVMYKDQFGNCDLREVSATEFKKAPCLGDLYRQGGW